MFLLATFTLATFTCGSVYKMLPKSLMPDGAQSRNAENQETKQRSKGKNKQQCGESTTRRTKGKGKQKNQGKRAGIRSLFPQIAGNGEKVGPADIGSARIP
jgi:hypothetical protein